MPNTPLSSAERALAAVDSVAPSLDGLTELDDAIAKEAERQLRLLDLGDWGNLIGHATYEVHEAIDRLKAAILLEAHNHDRVLFVPPEPQ